MKDFFEEFIKSAVDIISIPSVQEDPLPDMPFGEGVKRCLDKTLSICRELGFRTVTNGGYYGYAEIGEGEELFGILGHLDTVPFGDGWDYPPTSGTIKDGVLYGRGVLDDKAPILSTVFAVKELIERGLFPNKRIRIIFGCNEESGWKCIDKYLEYEEMPTQGFSPDGDFPVINCEKGIVYYEVAMPTLPHLLSIKGGERPNMVMESVTALLDSLSPKAVETIATRNDTSITKTDNCFCVTAYGKSAHGSTPNEGKNAFLTLVETLSEEYSGEWKNLCDIINNTDGSGYSLALKDEVSGRLTINIGKVFTEEDRLVFTLDVRHPISYSREYVYDALTKVFPSADIRQTMFHDSLYIAKDHPLVTKLLGAYEKVTGEKAEPITIGGGTYARALNTGVAFGPIFPGGESTIHQRNERANISDLKKMYEIYKEAIKDTCFETAKDN